MRAAVIAARYGAIICIGVFLLTPVYVRAGTGALPEGRSYRESVLRIQQKIESGHLSDARAALLAALRKFPSNGGLENLLGVVDVQQGHVNAARRDFSAAIRDDPSLLSAYLNLGRVLMPSAAQNLTVRRKAVHLYDEVLRREPGNEDANFQLAILLMWQKEYRESLDRVARLPESAHRDVRVQAVICADQAGLGNKHAARTAAASMEGNPRLTEQDVMLALPELRSGHQAHVIAGLLSAANDRHPLSKRGLRLLGLAEEAEGKLKLSQATLERVYGMDSTWVVPLVDLARVAMKEKNYKAALGYLAHARALQPHNASLAYEFGLVCVKLGLLDETIKAMGDAVKLAPDNPEYNLSMGLISSFGFNPETALPYLKKYHAMRPKDPEGVLALGTGYFRAGDLSEAAGWLQRAAKYPKTAGRAHYYLGRILFQHGKYREAIEQLEESKKVQSNRADVYVELGKSYIHLKEYALAEKVLDRAIQLDPKSYNANLALLRVYSFTQDPRREEQQKRFLAVHKERQKEYVDSLRTVTVRPQWRVEDAHPSAGAGAHSEPANQH